MTERVRSDAVQTIRATVARSGGTRRPEVRLPDSRADELPEGVVRLTLDGSTYHASVVSVSGTTALRGAYDNARRARERDGTDHLAGWLEDAAVEFGRSVLLDVLVSGSQYGLRAPGEEAIYRVQHEPAGDLQDIARDLE